MPDDTSNLPATTADAELALIGGTLPLSLRILLDERMNNAINARAADMARAQGITPQHLIGKAAACRAIFDMALNWKLDPNFVARNTYQTPGGAIGFQGSLIQAVIQQSGRIRGGINREYKGDWTKLAGKYEMRTGQRGGEFAKATWTQADAKDLGIRLWATIGNEREPRYWPSKTEWFYLSQCFPLNSPLWATDPRTQIFYLAVRRFASQAVPELLGGMPFDEDDLIDASELSIDITPQAAPMPEHQAAAPVIHDVEEVEPWEVIRSNGEPWQAKNADQAVEAMRRILASAALQGIPTLDTAWQNNADGFIERLFSEGMNAEAKELREIYENFIQDLTPSSADPLEGMTENVQATAPKADDEPALPMATSPQAAPEKNFWAKASLRIDPPMQLDGKRPDWKVWPALILPKVNSAPSYQALEALWVDNADNIDTYGTAVGTKDREALTDALERARDKLRGDA